MVWVCLIPPVPLLLLSYLIETNEPLNEEARYHHKDGSIVYVKNIYIPPDKLLVINITIKDINQTIKLTSSIRQVFNDRK